jgi:NADH:ubiquinone oxidoreductase subunit
MSPQACGWGWIDWLHHRRNLRAGQANRWTRPWFHDQGLQQLTGTIRYPKAA